MQLKNILKFVKVEQSYARIAYFSVHLDSLKLIEGSFYRRYYSNHCGMQLPLHTVGRHCKLGKTKK